MLGVQEKNCCIVLQHDLHMFHEGDMELGMEARYEPVLGFTFLSYQDQAFCTVFMCNGLYLRNLYSKKVSRFYG